MGLLHDVGPAVESVCIGRGEGGRDSKRGRAGESHVPLQLLAGSPVASRPPRRQCLLEGPSWGSVVGRGGNYPLTRPPSSCPRFNHPGGRGHAAVHIDLGRRCSFRGRDGCRGDTVSDGRPGQPALLVNLFHDPVKLVQVLGHLRRGARGSVVTDAVPCRSRRRVALVTVAMVTCTAVVGGRVGCRSPHERPHARRRGGNWRVVPFFQRLDWGRLYDVVEKVVRFQFEVVFILKKRRRPAVAASTLSLCVGCGETPPHSAVAGGHRR